MDFVYFNCTVESLTSTHKSFYGCNFTFAAPLDRNAQERSLTVGDLITEYALNFPSAFFSTPLPMPSTMARTRSPTHTEPPNAKDLLPSGRNRRLKDVESVVDWVEPCQRQLQNNNITAVLIPRCFPPRSSAMPWAGALWSGAANPATSRPWTPVDLRPPPA